MTKCQQCGDTHEGPCDPEILTEIARIKATEANRPKQRMITESGLALLGSKKLKGLT